jgi:hypothetical protein
MKKRKYLPTLSDLIDRLSIVMLKSVFIAENREAYLKERALIEHDIDLLLDENNDLGQHLGALDVRAIMAIALSNYFIWTNEAEARKGGTNQNEKLRATHSINGIRNTAKNVLAKRMGERLDLKIDTLAADLPADLGNWRMFEDVEV